ncbi:hypothetical protein RJ640_028457 [Escallonia rubra]|uniref:Uncharacterized protein n=1 Tax=Escallonia rubra TaxID=112253 RepID=A0AA88U3X0_9ASTE|nr:hypothetical protein RJ640_028457 [Escallonia rubra]
MAAPLPLLSSSSFFYNHSNKINKQLPSLFRPDDEFRPDDGSYKSSSIIIPRTEHFAEHFAEHFGRSLSVDLPPQSCNDKLLGFAVYAVMTSHAFDGSKAPFIDMFASLVRYDNSEKFYEIRKDFRVSSAHVWLVYVRVDHVFRRFGLNSDCRLIKFHLFEHGCSAFRLVQKGGARLIYKEDVILPLEDQMMPCPSNYHSPIVEDITEPAVENSNGEPARSIRERTLDDLNLDDDPPATKKQKMQAAAQPSASPGLSLSLLECANSPSLLLIFHNPFTLVEDITTPAVENSNGEPARSIRERTLDDLNLDDDPPATKKQKMEAAAQPSASPALKA